MPAEMPRFRRFAAGDRSSVLRRGEVFPRTIPTHLRRFERSE
jgi:hypothetical protein